jgi:hypothetical protein
MNVYTNSNVVIIDNSKGSNSPKFKTITSSVSKKQLLNSNKKQRPPFQASVPLEYLQEGKHSYHLSSLPSQPSIKKASKKQKIATLGVKTMQEWCSTFEGQEAQ